jgi:DNA-binding response OmpR family regulator
MEAAFPLLVVVESSPEVVELTLQAVQQSGVKCGVNVRGDAQAAIDLLLQDSQNVPYLLVLECAMPDVDPTPILKAIRQNERMRSVPIVILGKGQTEENVKSFYQSGANSCIDHPLEQKDFIERIAFLVRYWLKFNRIRIPRIHPWS